MRLFFLIPALIFVAWGVVSSIVIVSYISRRGVKINPALLRLYLPKYAGQYRKITLAENGKTGFWYYSFVVSMNAALVLAVLGLVFFK